MGIGNAEGRCGKGSPRIKKKSKEQEAAKGATESCISPVCTDDGKGLNDTDAKEEVVNGGVIKRRKVDGKEMEEGRKVKSALHG
jgi:hypothetical protein